MAGSGAAASGSATAASPAHHPAGGGPPHPRPGRPAGRHPVAGLAVVLAVLAVGLQILHPLVRGELLTWASIGSVVLFAGASLTHVVSEHSLAVALRVLAVAGGIGLAAEAVGVASGVPFGEYQYSGGLGPRLLGVPLVVPLAWTMMAYPCLLVGRRLARLLHASRVAQIGLAAWTLTAWDLFLDPQMVAAGHWSWAHPSPSLPGIPGIPLTNYAGWLLVATLISTALDVAVPVDGGTSPGRPVAAPALLLGWTWLGSALGNVAFFGRPAVAAWGAAAMGVTVLPYLVSVLRPGHPDAPPVDAR